MNYGRIVKYLSEELKNEKDIIIPICLNSPYAFEDAGEKIRNDKDVIRESVKYNWEIMKYVPDDFLCDDELLSIAYEHNHNILHDLHIG